MESKLFYKPKNHFDKSAGFIIPDNFFLIECKKILNYKVCSNIN